MADMRDPLVIVPKDPNEILKLSYADLQVSGWQTPQLRHPSIYHLADLCNVRVPLADLDKILKRIPLCLRAMSIQANYKDDPVSAVLLTLEDIEFGAWRQNKSAVVSVVVRHEVP